MNYLNSSGKKNKLIRPIIQNWIRGTDAAGSSFCRGRRGEAKIDDGEIAESRGASGIGACEGRGCVG